MKGYFLVYGGQMHNLFLICIPCVLIVQGVINIENHFPIYEG